MSQWTHVAGIIRIDSMDMLIPGLNLEAEIKKAFGVPCKFDDSEEVWDKCTVPMGSEGSIQYSTSKERENNSVYWGNIIIWGDLRDYSDSDAIREWITGSLEKLKRNVMIRSCSIKIDVEREHSYILYDSGGADNHFVLHTIPGESEVTA